MQAGSMTGSADQTTNAISIPLTSDPEAGSLVAERRFWSECWDFIEEKFQETQRQAQRLKNSKFGRFVHTIWMLADYGRRAYDIYGAMQWVPELLTGVPA